MYKEVYGANAKLIIGESESKYIRELGNKYPEILKRELGKRDEDCGELRIIPVTPQLKIAIINPYKEIKCGEKTLDREILKTIVLVIKEFCNDHFVTSVECADDLFGSEQAREKLLKYIEE